jgi:hypothetical protein
MIRKEQLTNSEKDLLKDYYIAYGVFLILFILCFSYLYFLYFHHFRKLALLFFGAVSTFCIYQFRNNWLDFQSNEKVVFNGKIEQKRIMVTKGIDSCHIDIYYEINLPHKTFEIERAIYDKLLERMEIEIHQARYSKIIFDVVIM